MIILNDNLFSDETFYFIETKNEIENSPHNSTIIFNYNDKELETYKFCKKNNIEYGVIISSIREFIFLINLNCKYVLCKNLELAKELQNLADNYLTETKIILICKNFDNIEIIAKNQIDGIIKLELKGK